MRRPVFWSEDALADTDKTIAYIAARNPTAARKVLAEIREAASQLGKRAIGRPGRVTGTYEKTVVGRPYVIAYAIDPLANSDERIAILRVIHTARDWPAEHWPEM